MNRKDFFKKACMLGVCGCAAVPMLSMTNNFASNESNTDDKPDWRLGFMKDRFAKLVELIGENVDSKTKDKMFEEMGRECSRLGFEHIKKYVGDFESFAKDAEAKWAESIEYDKGKGIITSISKQKENCFCPFVDKSKTPKDFCNCSLGWQKETFKAITGKEIEEAKVESSILRGGKSCNFKMKVS